jgi:hypothetical protein
MLSRKGYSTQVLRGFDFRGGCGAVDLAGDALDLRVRPIVLVGKGAEALIGLEVWQMLLANDFGPKPGVALVLLDCSDPQTAALAVPRSRLDRLFFGTGTDWPQFDSEFAWIPALGLLMLGKPTEEAWDEFTEAAKAALAALM